ncbi:hypothetical protein Ancab_039878 [Ancistrocladus abbreviatus]
MEERRDDADEDDEEEEEEGQDEYEKDGFIVDDVEEDEEPEEEEDRESDEERHKKKKRKKREADGFVLDEDDYQLLEEYNIPVHRPKVGNSFVPSQEFYFACTSDVGYICCGLGWVANCFAFYRKAKSSGG